MTSQVGQDLWVQSLIPIPGRFLDIGCGRPVEGSNTYELEIEGWTGFLVDKNQAMIDECRKYRKAVAICADARDIIMGPELKTVDYLSLDVDEDTCLTLLSILQQGLTFRCATIEHDSYRFGDRGRNAMREILESQRYVLAKADVTCGGLPFEDWWVCPELA